MAETVCDSHGQPGPASPWVIRFAPLIAAGGEVLDYASGRGRHARWLAQQGWRVEAVDSDAVALAELEGVAGVRRRAADLEHGVWPFLGHRFEGVVVTNYLFRPRFELLLDLVTPGGIGTVLETMMIWQLLQVQHLENTPLILVGKMWPDLVEWAKASMLSTDPPLASPEDMAIPVCVAGGDEAIARIREHHRAWLRAQRKRARTR